MKKNVYEYKPLLISVLFMTVILAFSCSPSASGSSMFPVNDPPPPVKKDPALTLLVYMAADNDLERYALENLKAMENAVYEDIDVLVLLDRSEGYDETDGNWTDTRLFKVSHDENGNGGIVSSAIDCSPLNLSAGSSTELDMSNPSVLKKFIEFAKTDYKATRYALIIWGHGTGWRYAYSELGASSELRVSSELCGVPEPVEGPLQTDVRAIAIDDKTGSYMSVHDLGSAVEGQQLCVIGFDTCFGSTLETLYELKDCSEYVCASPGLTPSSGWDYKKLLETISASDYSSLEIAKAMEKAGSAATAASDCSKYDALVLCFEDFAKELSQAIIDSATQKDTFETLMNCTSYSYSQYPCDLFLDVAGLAGAYKTYQDTDLSQTCEALLAAVNATAVSSKNPSFSVHFIPLTARNTAAKVHNSDYLKNPASTDQCAFIKQSNWWVPTLNGNSESLLDKIFYTSF